MPGENWWDDAEPHDCSACGKSATSCGRSPAFCCTRCSETRFDTHLTNPAAIARADREDR